MSLSHPLPRFSRADVPRLVARAASSRRTAPSTQPNTELRKRARQRTKAPVPDNEPGTGWCLGRTSTSRPGAGKAHGTAGSITTLVGGAAGLRWERCLAAALPWHGGKPSCLSPNLWETRRGPRGSFPSVTRSTRRAPFSEKPPRLCLFLKLASLPGRWSRGERHGLMRIRSTRPQEAEGPPGVLVFHSCSVPEPDRAPA